MIPNIELQLNCLHIEKLVALMVMKGMDDRTIVNTIAEQFNPQTTFEQETYSEAIIYAKQSILN